MKFAIALMICLCVVYSSNGFSEVDGFFQAMKDNIYKKGSEEVMKNGPRFLHIWNDHLNDGATKTQRVKKAIEETNLPDCNISTRVERSKEDVISKNLTIDFTDAMDLIKKIMTAHGPQKEIRTSKHSDIDSFLRAIVQELEEHEYITKFVRNSHRLLSLWKAANGTVETSKMKRSINDRTQDLHEMTVIEKNGEEDDKPKNQRRDLNEVFQKIPLIWILFASLQEMQTDTYSNNSELQMLHQNSYTTVSTENEDNKEETPRVI